MQEWEVFPCLTIPRQLGNVQPTGRVNSNLPHVLLQVVKVEMRLSLSSVLANLTSADFDIINDPNGWLDCSIQQAQVLLQQHNPLIDGLQRPTLGRVRNFDIASGEFIQILHTGTDHWLCISSIGCSPGVVNLFGSFYNDVILTDVEEQTKMYLKCGHFRQHALNAKTFLCFHTSRQYQSFGDSRECPSNPHPSYRVYMKNSNHSPHPLEFPIPSMRGGRGCMDIIFWNHTYHFLCKSLMHTSGIAT